MKRYRFFSHFRHAEEGIAYVEFALMLPMLIALFVCTIEVTRYILITQKVQKVSMTVADVVAQAETITSGDLANIVDAASQIMQPYAFGANGYVIISSVTQTGAQSPANPPKVSWQYSGGGTMNPAPGSKIGAVGGTADLSNSIPLNSGDNVIVTEVYYNYTPLLAINGSVNGQQLNVMGAQQIYQVGLYKPRFGALSTLGMLYILKEGALL